MIMIFHNNTVNCFRNLTEPHSARNHLEENWILMRHPMKYNWQTLLLLCSIFPEVCPPSGHRTTYFYPCEIQTWPFRMRVNIALPSLKEFSRTCDQTDNPSFSWYTDSFKSKVYLYISDLKSIFLTVSRWPNE